jgi:hypothetical protein
MKISRLHIAVLSISALVILSGCVPKTATQQPSPAPAQAKPTQALAPTKPAPPTAAPTAEAAKPTAVPVAVAELKGDMIRGAKLYDSWWVEALQEDPTDNNPLWAKQTTNKAKGANT